MYLPIVRSSTSNVQPSSVIVCTTVGTSLFGSAPKRRQSRLGGLSTAVVDRGAAGVAASRPFQNNTSPFRRDKPSLAVPSFHLNCGHSTGARRQHGSALPLKQGRPDNQVGVACFVFDGREYHPAARHLADQHQPRHRQPRAASRAAHTSAKVAICRRARS